MNERRGRIRAFLMCICLIAYAPPAYVMMAGALPDTPAARVDSNATNSMWSGVGSVVVSGSSYSGVLVAPRFVLTAAHVAGYANPANVQFVLNFGGDQTHVIQAQSITRYPTASFPYDDLTLIELAMNAPAGVAIYPLARLGTPIQGRRAVLVGYGGSGNGDVGVSVAGSRTVKRKGENVLDSIQTTLDASGKTSLFYLYDFDGPAGTGSFGGGTLGNAVETIVAGSDSGSPAFIVDGTIARLVGINTFVAGVNGQPADSRFGTIGGGILLTKQEFLDWIDATTGYTTIGASVDVPLFPPWAIAFCMLAISTSVWRIGVRVATRRSVPR